MGGQGLAGFAGVKLGQPPRRGPSSSGPQLCLHTCQMPCVVAWMPGDISVLNKLGAHTHWALWAWGLAVSCTRCFIRNWGGGM